MSAVLDREDMQGLIARGAGEEGRLEFVNGEAKLVECPHWPIKTTLWRENAKFGAPSQTQRDKFMKSL
jgi:hypothetical protein